MYSNFKEYWNAKKVIFEKLGIDKEIAKIIWDDCCDCVIRVLRNKHS